MPLASLPKALQSKKPLEVVIADYVQQNAGVPSSARPLRGQAGIDSLRARKRSLAALLPLIRWKW